MNFRRSWARLLAVAVVGTVLCILWFGSITGSPVLTDASHTLRMAINLQHHGIMSLDDAPPRRPSMYREPAPVVATALMVGLLDSQIGKAPAEQYFSGHRAQFLKYQNVAWLALLTISTFCALSHFGVPFWVALAGAAWTSVPFFADSDPQCDTLFSELPAAAILMPASLLMAIGVRRRRLSWLVAGAMCFGILTLIKASFLYVYAAVVAILALCYATRLTPSTSRGGVREIGALVVAFAIVVTPWMYRNYASIGSFGISDRGGIVLYQRALLDQMTPEEYRGSFYLWSRKSIQPLVGSALGFMPLDLEPGGRLHRLSRNRKGDLYEDDLAAEEAGEPGDAVTYYRIGRAERIRLENEFKAQGHPQPVNAADKVLLERATRVLRDHWGKHLAVTLPLLWRSALIDLPILVFGFVYCLTRRRYDLALFSLPALAMLMLLALLTSFIPRYSTVYGPVTKVMFVFLVCTILPLVWTSLRPFIETYRTIGRQK